MPVKSWKPWFDGAIAAVLGSIRDELQKVVTENSVASDEPDDDLTNRKIRTNFRSLSLMGVLKIHPGCTVDSYTSLIQAILDL